MTDEEFIKSLPEDLTERHYRITVRIIDLMIAFGPEAPSIFVLLQSIATGIIGSYVRPQFHQAALNDLAVNCWNRLHPENQIRVGPPDPPPDPQPIRLKKG